MTKSFAFLFVFASTYILVQGIDQPSTGSQCNCCDQCDQTATVSKLLLDMSNLLANDDSVNTTSHPSTASTPSTTAPLTETTKNGEATTTTDTATTGFPSTTQNPPTIVYSSEIRDAPAPIAPAVLSSSTPVNTFSTVNSSTAVDPSTTADPSSSTDSFTKSESFTTTKAAIKTDSSSSTINVSTMKTTDSKAKMSVCPENCYLDISGEYCNCYLVSAIAETEQIDG